ncbi:MAG: PEP-CTERM sorting domain-containing protein [Phycisphaerales bacterium]|nr:PEP-CTERM sorting domain-containing protein [Phycisphaerales bacterium]
MYAAPSPLDIQSTAEKPSGVSTSSNGCAARWGGDAGGLARATRGCGAPAGGAASMNPRPLCIAFCAAIAVLAAPAGTRGDLVTFEFTAITQGFVDHVGLGWTVPDGTQVIGRFTFDTAIADDSPSNVQLGRYFDSVISSIIQIGDHQTEDAGLDSFVVVTNGFSGEDLFQMVDRSLDFRGIPVDAGIVLEDSDAAVFDDDLILTTPPPLNEFEGRLFAMLADDNSFSAGGTVTSLTLVPEPGTLLLLVGAGLLVGWRGRRFGDRA